MSEFVGIGITMSPSVDDGLTVRDDTGGLTLAEKDSESGGPELGGGGIWNTDLRVESQSEGDFEVLGFIYGGCPRCCKSGPHKVGGTVRINR
jgi:hypothetical protein